MNTHDVTAITAPDISAAGLANLMDCHGIAPLAIDTVNWPEQYPYAPNVKIRIAHSPEKLLLNWQVSETSVRACVTNDNGPVWEDSCVELFLSLPGRHDYFNIECNCIGTLLIGIGPNRNNRRHLPLAALAQVERCASLGRKSFDERVAPSLWSLSLVIPTAIFGVETLAGVLARANFYKCGDKLTNPHFLSWNPVNAPAPNFHLPDYFGLLKFKSGI